MSPIDHQKDRPVPSAERIAQIRERCQVEEKLYLPVNAPGTISHGFLWSVGDDGEAAIRDLMAALDDSERRRDSAIAWAARWKALAKEYRGLSQWLYQMLEKDVKR